MIKEKIKISGRLRYLLIDKNGKIKQKGRSHNLVVTEGDNYLADKFLPSPTKDGIICIVLGTGWTSAEKSDTWVSTPFADNGHNVVNEGGFDSGYPKIKDGSPNIVQIHARFEPGYATHNGIDEAVISNKNPNVVDGSEPDGGSILAHGQLDPVVNKAAGDELKVYWEITFEGSA